MDRDELDKKHPLYDSLFPLWEFWTAAYGGIEELLNWGVIKQHERESDGNFQVRKEKAYGFNYSKSIINIFSFYLNTKPPSRELGALAEDTQWKKFTDDCDLCGSSWDRFLQQQQKQASITGFVGILIDRPALQVQTKADESAAGIYAYAVAYKPEQILDFKFTRNSVKRPVLSYLKLQEDDGSYLVWTLTTWSNYIINEKGEVDETASGSNTLGEIPFVFLENQKNLKYKHIGISDIIGIARIDASIIRNLSQGEEVIDYAAFPMMRKPMQQAGMQKEDEAGVTAILEFDPTIPESKPDWLEAIVQEPIDAILKWIERKQEEIYRESNTAGLLSGETSATAMSGIALKQEFQLLNAVLVEKASNMDEAELYCVYYWLKWQNREGVYGNISIKRPTDFSIEDLVTDLANALSAKSLVNSNTFKNSLQKRIARLMLPGEKDDQLSIIDAEIDEYKPAAVEIPPAVNDKGEPMQQGGMKPGQQQQQNDEGGDE